ncbi:MAG: VTT domain-containing protein [Verrucomicrobiales bacterium]|nr:VTT domain-containing protein [Verrucomicrobiales bacterium]
MNPTFEVLALPAGFHTWPALAQATVLGLLTLVSEDGVAVGAGILGALGAMGWHPAFWGTCLGIWLGDAALYGSARRWGRPLLSRPWIQRWIPPQRLAKGQRWFARRGAVALVLSRLVPGTRLPTYLAAGLVRMPFLKFALVTGLAALAWTTLIFAIAHAFGPAARHLLSELRQGALVLPLLIITPWLVLAGIRRLMPLPQVGRRLRTSVLRWRHWEFWPAWLFYAPVAAYLAWLMIRFRSLTLPLLANPGMPNAGIVGESKHAILNQLRHAAPNAVPPSTLLEPGPQSRRLEALRQWMAQHQVEFPIVLKPDLGQRGLGVKVVRHFPDAAHYFAEVVAATIAQAYVPGPFEAGIFYVRHPQESQGRIVSITEKVFPHVEGDGIRTLEDLIWDDPRARCLANRYLARLGARRSEVPPLGAKVRLVEAGNHAQGCIFVDGMAWHSPALEARIDAISRAIPGFFFGRYDIRFSSVDALRDGRGFQILELNGASAEMTAIYDRRNSLATAYRTLFRQWRTVFEIGEAHRQSGHRAPSLGRFLEDWRLARQHFAKCPAAD